MTTTIEMSRIVNVPVRNAYDQWTQFEDMKLYVPGVRKVRQVEDNHVHLTYKRRGVERTWDARITEQIPDARIAWESVSEQPEHAGVVTFHHIDDDHTKIMVQLEFWPTGFFEHYADKVGLVRQFVDEALDGFEEFIEDRRRPTGAWRGLIGRDDLETHEDDIRDARAPTTTGNGHRAEAAAPQPTRDTPERSDEADEADEAVHTTTMADGEIVLDRDPEQTSA